jgi:hypothetical protein
VGRPTTTTIATFSTEKGHEGQFLGTTTETTTSTMKGNTETTTTTGPVKTDYFDATQAISSQNMVKSHSSGKSERAFLNRQGNGANCNPFILSVFLVDRRNNWRRVVDPGQSSGRYRYYSRWCCDAMVHSRRVRMLSHVKPFVIN